jgi:hypothetical protein
VEQALQSVEFASLKRVNTKIYFSQQSQVLNVFQLVDLFDVVQIQIQELQTLNRFQALELAYLVFRKVQGSQNWQ